MFSHYCNIYCAILSIVSFTTSTLLCIASHCVTLLRSVQSSILNGIVGGERLSEFCTRKIDHGSAVYIHLSCNPSPKVFSIGPANWAVGGRGRTRGFWSSTSSSSSVIFVQLIVATAADKISAVVVVVVLVCFLSATEYFPSRTIIQPGWVSSSLSSSSSSSLLILFCNGIT